MPLAAGTRLGPYEIIAAIGAGGMGEVYRARDTKLDRDVAVKILPDVFAGDADRLARFAREAKTLAALNHPGIAAIYGIEANALVMELVEGEDLSLHIARGPIPLEDALSLAKQIVAALEAAHEQGIVHRDLKPANVKVRTDGTVKVLDFGLAKALSPDGASGAGAMNSPTITARATELGMIIGTAAYMSPEQARGRAVDRRADIWAFGVVLYEMLTGTRAFDGDDISITLASVLKEDVHWDSLPADLPAPISRLLRRCLDKDPKRRLRDIGEARLVLEDPAALEPVATRADVSAARTSVARRVLPWAVAAVLGIGLLAALLSWAPWTPVAAPQPISFVVGPPVGETLSAPPGLVAISPDGQQIAFVTGTKLWIRRLGSLSPTLVASAAGAWHPTWSPDGQSIVFTGTGGPAPLKRVDIAGGPAIKLAESAVERPAWSSANVILYTNESDRRLYRVAATGGPSVPVTELDKTRQETKHTWPVFLSDGRRFIYCTENVDPSKSALYLASLDSKERTHLVDVLSMVEVVPGFLIYGREGTLMAHPFDERTGRLTGDPMPVLENVQSNALNGRLAFDLSRNGILVYRSGPSSENAGVYTWFDRSGKALGTVGKPADYLRGTLSPDGERLVTPQFDTSRQHTDLVMLDLARGVPARFTSDPADDLYPLWSPDSQTVVFQSNRKGVGDLFVKASGGATTERVLFESPDDKTPTGFSQDGKTLLFVAGTRAAARLWALPMTGDPKPVRVFPGSSETETAGRFSPDGHWIAYVVSEGPRDGNVFVQSFPPNGVKTRISSTTGFNPMWTADGKQIVYRSADKFLAVDVTMTNGQLRPSLPKELFTQPQINTQGRGSNGFAMDAKGERFLLLVDPTSSTQSAGPEPLTVIVNWAATLGKRK